MISANAKIPNSLINKLNKSKLEQDVSALVEKTGEDALKNVKEFGLGVGSVFEPTGGAPHWQGKITNPGHYSGYLSDTHNMRMQSRYHASIVSDAEFLWGVIEGYSTNRPNVTFPPNFYHKRAVDKLLSTNLYGNKIQENWSEIRNKGTGW